jgi:CheY-like chemotaxis protein
MHKKILLIEDSDEDFATFTRVLNQLSCIYPVYRCCDGDEALDFLAQEEQNRNRNTSSFLSLILLDLNLPGTDGREILEEIKQKDRLKSIPVVIFTTSSNPQDIKICYQKGANSYVLKPMKFEELKKTIENLLTYWFEINLISFYD